MNQQEIYSGPIQTIVPTKELRLLNTRSHRVIREKKEVPAKAKDLMNV